MKCSSSGARSTGPAQRYPITPPKARRSSARRSHRKIVLLGRPGSCSSSRASRIRQGARQRQVRRRRQVPQGGRPGGTHPSPSPRGRLAAYVKTSKTFYTQFASGGIQRTPAHKRESARHGRCGFCVPSYLSTASVCLCTWSADRCLVHSACVIVHGSVSVSHFPGTFLCVVSLSSSQADSLSSTGSKSLAVHQRVIYTSQNSSSD